MRALGADESLIFKVIAFCTTTTIWTMNALANTLHLPTPIEKRFEKGIVTENQKSFICLNALNSLLSKKLIFRKGTQQSIYYVNSQLGLQ